MGQVQLSRAGRDAPIPRPDTELNGGKWESWERAARGAAEGSAGGCPGFRVRLVVAVPESGCTCPQLAGEWQLLALGKPWESRFPLF